MTPIESMLVNILRSERPSGFLIPDHLNLNHWEAKLDRECLRFGGISQVEDYLSRRTIGRPAPATDRPPVVPSPLGLAASMDYFNMAWRLAYGEPSGPFRYAAPSESDGSLMKFVLARSSSRVCLLSATPCQTWT